jgi:hypothetical protein
MITLARVAKVNWADELDLRKAADNVRGEFVGDWYRDPWGWPELSYLLKHEPNVIFDNLSTYGSRRAALIDVPKENWGSRPAVVLDILDRVTYQALADRLSVDLIGSMSPSVYGWRLPPKDPKPGHFSHNNIQWDGYRNHLVLCAAKFEVALKTDIVSFFASVALDLVKDRLDDLAPKNAISRRLVSILEGFGRIPERSGLPQRSTASAVLANMVLAPVDDVLQHHALDLPDLRLFHEDGEDPPRRSFARWMDDVWLFVEDPALARRAQTELQNVTRSLGLDLNLAKTEVLEGDAVAKDALEIEHSAVDTGLFIRDTQPLEELIERLLDDPARASRTSLKFVATRMRAHNNRYRVQDFVLLAKRMPHAADALAQLFKVAFTSPSLQDWFLDYARSDWAAFQWSVGQYARMFTSHRPAQKVTRQFFSEVVADAQSSLPLLAVAANRLAAWDPTEARAVIREAISSTSHPQPRRVLALAALQAGESRATIRKWLRQEDENDLTLRLLSHYNFAPPKVNADFAN